MSACCPLLLEGGVRGGREEQCSTYCFYIGCDRFCLATTPRRCAPHPSSPEEGTTLGARMSDHAGCLFYVFARRRGDFAEMMGVRGEARGACSPELTSSQTSRHAVPTASTGVLSVFFNIFRPFRFRFSDLPAALLLYPCVAPYTLRSSFTRALALYPPQAFTLAQPPPHTH